jgi:Carbohydrate binding domain
VEVWSQTTAVSHINHFIYLTSEVETGGWAFNIPAGGYGTLGAATNAKMEVDYVRYYSRAERVGNSGWTNRIGNWDQSGNSSWSATGGRSGGAGGRINPQTTSGANFEQTVSGLIPGVPYVLTGWGTVGATAWPDIRIGVKNFGGAQIYDGISSTGFTEAEVPFTMGMSNTSARVFAWVPTQWGDAYADDMQVRRAAATMDAGFESGDKDEFWSPYGDTLVHSWSPVRSGAYSFRFNNPAADRGLEQTIRGLTPGTTYRFSCWMRTDNQSLQLGVKNHGAAQTSTSRTGTGNTWTKHTHTFTMGATATSATVFAYIPSTAANSVVDVDDFFLAESLAAEWTATDIGTVGLAGESGMRSGRWVLRGSGSDIWSTADSHRFVHKGLTGDGAVTARLRSFETDRTTSKSGVMMRASLAANAQVVHLGWRGDDRMETIRRTTTAGSATADLGTVGDRVEWVRIHRRGNVFTTAHSPDGIAWTNIGAPQTIAMPATIFAGLSACAATTTDWTETSAENLSVAPDTAPTITVPTDQSVYESTATSALAFTVGDDFTAATALTVSKASSNTTLVPAANIVLGGSGANRTVTVTPAANQSGTATITLTVSDGVLASNDTFVLTVVDPTTPRNPAPAA